MQKDTIYTSERNRGSKIVHALIFDMGGVIFPLDHMITCRKLSRHCKYGPKKIYDKIFDSELEDFFANGQITSKTFYHELKNMLKFDDLSFDEFLEIWSNIFQKDQAVWKLIEEFNNKGVNLYLLSNTDKVHFEHLEKKYEVSRLFDDCILSFRVGKTKPDPEIYKVAMQKAELPPEDLVFIDDTRENVLGANSLGLNAIHFRSPGGLREDLASFEIAL
ncbi:HAD family phosphatase [Candidatus Bipolaricaulota bacterium]|nr:HAD family phosphatase [Candidatus Bipolaricaulota bacterium]